MIIFYLEVGSSMIYNFAACFRFGVKIQSKATECMITLKDFGLGAKRSHGLRFPLWAFRSDHDNMRLF